MQHGKDVISDKPGFTTLEQLAEARRVQAETGRIYSICYSERLEVRAAVKAGELVKAGAIGQVVQTVGLGPHRIHPPARPDWFYKKERFGGILTDIASHQADQFLFYTGSTAASVVAAQVANVAHPQYPEWEDFGDMMLRGNGGMGYVRVDWFTPQGSGHMGRRPADHIRDGRLYRAAQVHRHWRAPGRRPPVPRGRQGDPAYRLQRRGSALRAAAAVRRRPPHRDGHATGALLPGDAAGAGGTAAGRSGARPGPHGGKEIGAHKWKSCELELLAVVSGASTLLPSRSCRICSKSLRSATAPPGKAQAAAGEFGIATGHDRL